MKAKKFSQRIGVLPKVSDMESYSYQNLAEIQIPCLYLIYLIHLITQEKHSEERNVSCSLFPERKIMVPEMILKSAKPSDECKHGFFYLLLLSGLGIHYC